MHPDNAMEVDCDGNENGVGHNMAVRAETAAYRWERDYTEGLNIGQVLMESKTGTIEEAIQRMIDEAKRVRRERQRPTKVRLGNMRYLILCVDFSSAMISADYYPSRIQVVLAKAEAFSQRFFEQNPLSQLCIVACRDKSAGVLVPFSSSPHAIREALASCNNLASCDGEFSLSAALHVALFSLQPLPLHTSREVLFVMGSLATIDGEPLEPLMDRVRAIGVRCSAIELAAEMFVCKRMANLTGGRCAVALDESHFELLLMDHVEPPVVGNELEASQVQMGFPARRTLRQPSFCESHPPVIVVSSYFPACDQSRAYFCSRCGAHCCQMPMECQVCGVLLLTAPQLARAHQRLEPLVAFTERNLPDAAADNNNEDGDEEEEEEGRRCFACSQPLQGQGEKKAYVCGGCTNEFCLDCDLLLHSSLQVCPGCS